MRVKEFGIVLLTILILPVLSSTVVVSAGNTEDFETLQVRDATPTMLKPVTINLTIRAAAEYFGMGVKPAVICVFRVCKLAFKTLWPREPPLRTDILVITTNPTRAVRDVLEFITRCFSRRRLIVEKIPGTSPIKLTAENWVFTIVNEPTGEAVEIKVRKDVFPENLFKLRASVKSKIKQGITPSKEEIRAFNEAVAEFARRLKTWSDDKLFETRTFSYTPKPMDPESLISYYLPEVLPEWRRLKSIEENYTSLETDYERLSSEVEDLRARLSQAQTLQWILGASAAVFLITTLYLALVKKRAEKP